jgi:hypothetical protein
MLRTQHAVSIGDGIDHARSAQNNIDAVDLPFVAVAVVAVAFAYVTLRALYVRAFSRIVGSKAASALVLAETDLLSQRWSWHPR